MRDMREREFQADLAFSEGPQAQSFWKWAYREAFKRRFRATNTYGNNAAQRAGVERVMVFEDSGEVLKVEEKLRRDFYPDILLEYQANDQRQKPGWIETELKIDYLAYGYLDTPLAYFLPWPLLRSAWQANKQQWMEWGEEERWGFRKIVASNRPGYSTWSLAIPTEQLLSAMEEAALAYFPILTAGSPPAQPVVVVERRLLPAAESVTATSKELVIQVLDAEPETRHDVRLLTLRHWRREGLILTPEQEAMIPYLTQPETIRRVSRKILNEERRYAGHEEVIYRQPSQSGPQQELSF